MEELIQVLLHFATFGCVFSGLEISLFEQLPYGRRFFVDFRLVPSQLQVIRLLGAIRVAEGDVLDIVAHHLLGRRGEVVFRIMHQQGMGACDDIYQHRLSSAVGSHNGNMLTVAKTEIDGLCQPPGGHTRHSLFYVDNLLHSISLSSFHSSVRNPSTNCNGGPYFQVLMPAGNGNRRLRGHPWHP